MKKLFIVTVSILFSFFASAQNSESIIIGEKEIIYSNVLNEDRKLWIYTPNMTSHNSSSNKRYPVLYVLDGDAHFFSTVGIIQQLSQANGNGVLPEMIVVAIENTNRFRDLVPSDDLIDANPFIDFLSSELIPYIDENYHTAPYKLLVGHSLCGLFAIDLLTAYPRLFNAYIAIDPSMWYDNEKFLNKTVRQLPRQLMNGIKLFVGTANTIPRGMTISELENDNSAKTQHIRSIFKLDEFLKTNTNGLQYAQKYYETEGHNTVPLLSEYDGLRYIFDYYHLHATEKDFADSTALIASKLKTHYDKVSEEMGYKNSAPEAFINYFAYEALGKKHYKKAEALFKLNIEGYPESSNVYNSYAEYFLTINDTINAIANYKKALEIENSEETQRKLDALTTQAILLPASIDLDKFAGVYVLETYNIPVILEVRNGTLWSKVPGQEDSEFQLLSENVFTVKGKQGYTITIQMNGDNPLGFTSVQPNGTFQAVYKNK